MTEPIVFAQKPAVLDLEPGDYWWCACGKSANGTFCDGSHKGTGLAPTKVTIDAKKTVALCLCKRSQNGALCDGSHAKL
jgi:CDGSH-type Zn-finger protein